MNRCTFSGIAGLAVAVMLVGCRAQLSPLDEIRINERFELMYALAKIPAPPPRVLYRIDDGWMRAAETDCTARTITINYAQAAMYPEQIIALVIPHEYAHWMSCHYRGNTDGGGGDPHDAWWRKAVVQLGGDPDYI